MSKENNKNLSADEAPPWWERFWIYQSIKKRLIILGQNKRTTEEDYDR